jgi:hypothetical protein
MAKVSEVVAVRQRYHDSDSVLMLVMRAGSCNWQRQSA